MRLCCLRHYVVVLIMLSLPRSIAVGDDGVILEVHAGKWNRRGTPVSWELPEKFRGNSAFRLTRVDADRQVDVQKVAGSPPRVIWMIHDELKAGGTRRYRLVPDKTVESPAVVNCRKTDKHLIVTVGRKPVLHYNHATTPSPDPTTPYYARSGYLHPLFTPDGHVMTGDFDPDHPHQHGVMFAWTNTTFEGRAVNFWDQKAQTGKVEHVSVKSLQSGPVFGGFTVSLRHTDLTAPGGPKPVLDETWTVRVYRLSDEFLFDLESVQSCAGKSPLVINKYHYGGMAIRGRSEWLLPAVSDFLTAEGKTRKDGNHTRPNWVEMHGKLAGAACGVTIFGHPSNFRSPQPVRLNPSKPYFVFAPLVLGSFEITPGKPYVSRFRYNLHRGGPHRETATRHWHDYADPLAVRLVGDLK
jgi:hypothetical protein